jgi:hypothetical protein
VALTLATQYATFAALKAFFRWLAGQPGFKKRLRYSDADYFSMSRGATRIAKRASLRASVMTSKGTGLRPSQRPTVARFRSRACRSFATKPAFSNWDTAPRI